MTTPYTIEPLQIFTKLNQNLKMQNPWLPDQTKPNPDNILLNLTQNLIKLNPNEVKFLTVFYSLRSYEPLYPSIKELNQISHMMGQPTPTIRKLLLNIRTKIRRQILNKKKQNITDPFILKQRLVGQKITPKTLHNTNIWTHNNYKLFTTNFTEDQVTSTLAKVKHQKQPHNFLPLQIAPPNPNYAQPTNNFSSQKHEEQKTWQLRSNLNLTNQEALRTNNRAISHARRLQENEQFPGESASYEFWIYEELKISKIKCKLNRDGIVIPTDEIKSIFQNPETIDRDYTQVQRPITPQPTLLATLHAASGRTGTIDETLELENIIDVGEDEFENYM